MLLRDEDDKATILFHSVIYDSVRVAYWQLKRKNLQGRQNHKSTASIQDGWSKSRILDIRCGRIWDIWCSQIRDIRLFFTRTSTYYQIRYQIIKVPYRYLIGTRNEGIKKNILNQVPGIQDHQGIKYLCHKYLIMKVTPGPKSKIINRRRRKTECMSLKVGTKIFTQKFRHIFITAKNEFHIS